MNILTGSRIGTPVTEEERNWISEEIGRLEAYKNDLDALKRSTRAYRNIGITSWDVSLEITCVEADITMYKRTLEAGVVSCGESN